MRVTPSAPPWPSSPPSARLSPFARFAWGVLGYNLLVILWGAFVRATGSGAGCGSHWPLCNGEVVPRAPRIETLIELTHRITSGVALVLVVAMTIWAFRAHGKGSLVRRGAVLSTIFILTEALIGAGLVLFELVAHDKSMKRALSMSLHLSNTFVLLACLTLTAYWASGGARLRWKGQGSVLVFVAPALLAVLLVGTSGGIAALGDTLFPARSLADGIAEDFSPAAHVFVRLRALHPFLAAGAGVFLIGAASAVRFLRRTVGVGRAARAVVVLFLLQFTAGLLNMMLLAPVAMQLVHLLLADALWIALILLGATALADAPAARAEASLEGASPADAASAASTTA